MDDLISLFKLYDSHVHYHIQNGLERESSPHAEESIVEVGEVCAGNRKVGHGLTGAGGHRVDAPHLQVQFALKQQGF